MTATNPERLKAFVRKCLDRAETEADPVAFLKANIAHVEAQSREAERLARLDKDPPAHLAGLGLFEFSAAITDLHGEIARREKVAA